MSTTQEIAPPKVRWDLSALFSGIDDPRIPETWTRLMAASDDFASRYRGKIETPDLTAQTLAEGLKEIEGIAQESAKPMNFAHLLFACDTSDPQLGAFLQKQMEKAT